MHCSFNYVTRRVAPCVICFVAAGVCVVCEYVFTTGCRLNTQGSPERLGAFGGCKFLCKALSRFFVELAVSLVGCYCARMRWSLFS